MRSSTIIMIIAATADSRSAKGPAQSIPSIPQKSGSTISGGSRNSICRVSDRNAPLKDLPIEVKNMEAIGCRQLSQVKNRNIRKNFTPNSKYSSEPLPKIAMISRGNNWNSTNASTATPAPTVIAERSAT